MFVVFVRGLFQNVNYKLLCRSSWTYREKRTSNDKGWAERTVSTKSERERNPKLECFQLLYYSNSFSSFRISNVDPPVGSTCKLKISRLAKI